jgi:hypothetical protein
MARVATAIAVRLDATPFLKFKYYWSQDCAKFPVGQRNLSKVHDLIGEKKSAAHHAAKRTRAEAGRKEARQSCRKWSFYEPGEG